MPPIHFGPWQTVYWWFHHFVRRLLFRTIYNVALMIDRERVGHEASPGGDVLDSQTVKAPFAETRGYDGGKKIVGRKRHIAVDTDGRLLMVNQRFRPILPLGRIGHVLAQQNRIGWIAHQQRLNMTVGPGRGLQLEPERGVT